MIEDLRVICDRCGSGMIRHRRKNDLPVRVVKLSEWVREAQIVKSQPGIMQTVDMVAECGECLFTVEYSRMVSS